MTLEEVSTIPSIVVEKTTDFGSVSGTVTLLSNGSAMEGVTLKITPKDSNSYQTETVLTNATGGYQIPALIPGDYVATFSKNTFNTVEINFSLAANQQLTLDAVLDISIPVDQGPWVGLESYFRDDAFQTNKPKLIIWEIPERELRSPPNYKYRDTRYISDNNEWFTRVSALVKKAQ